MKGWVIVLAIILPIIGEAQTVIDALRTSHLQMQGSARYMGMGGSMSALGTDISVTSVNPSGIGLIRNSYLTLSPGIDFSSVDATHYGNTTKNQFNKFQIGNFGAVFNTTSISSSSRVKALNFGISSNKLADYSNNFVFSGINADNSLIDAFFNNIVVSGIDPNFPQDIQAIYPFTTNLAYETFVIDTFNGTFLNAIPFADNRQERSVEERGELRETNFSIATDIDHEFYLGASIGFYNLNFSSFTQHAEFMDPTDTTSALQDFLYEEDLAISGSGINLKLGALWRASDFFRVGAYWHSPTRISVEEQYSTGMISQFRGGQTFDFLSPNGVFEYVIRTPMRYGANLGFLINKYAAFNVDIEGVSHGRAKFTTQFEGDDGFADLNNDLQSVLRNSLNVRFGTEIKLKNNFVRAGFGYQSNPFEQNIISDWSTRNYSLGYGISFKKFSIDLAYSLWQFTDEYYIYDNAAIVNQGLESLQPSVREVSNTSIQLGLSMRL